MRASKGAKIKKEKDTDRPFPFLIGGEKGLRKKNH